MYCSRNNEVDGDDDDNDIRKNAKINKLIARGQLRKLTSNSNFIIANVLIYSFN